MLRGYTSDVVRRWRVEDLHKTWKSGACHLEDSQLCSTERIAQWAIIMVATAARIERIKYIARSESARPASIEFKPHEVEAMLSLKRKYKKRNELIRAGMQPA